MIDSFQVVFSMKCENLKRFRLFKFTDLFVEVLLHGVHDLTDLGGHDVALLAPVEHVEELLVFCKFGMSF